MINGKVQWINDTSHNLILYGEISVDVYWRELRNGDLYVSGALDPLLNLHLKDWEGKASQSY